MEMENSQNTGHISRPSVDSGIMQIRLDTSSLLEQIELFLRGAKLMVSEDPQTGKIRSQRVKLGLSKANDRGIQSILNWINATVNPHTVQGNFTTDKSGRSDMYDRYIEEYHIELASMLVNNCYDWEISDDEIDTIIEFIMLLIIPYMSRLIDNKERESYNETLKAIESNITRAKSGFPVIGNG